MCVLLTFAAAFPQVFVSPADRLPRLGETVAANPIAFAAPDFQRRFRVQALERSDALRVIDANMEQFLLDCDVKDLRLELAGGALLGHVPVTSDTDQLLALAKAVTGFHDHLPDVAWTHYGPL